MEEQVDVLTPSGAQSGVAKDKREVHRNGEWHAAAHLWIITPAGEILLQRRSASKENYPSLWDVSVAGHVSAGEDPSTAALRECEEEIGLSLSSEPSALAVLRWDQTLRVDYVEREFHYVYVALEDVDVTSLRLQESEVEAVKLVTASQFRELVESRDESLVPHWEEYALLLEHLSGSRG
jgi:isopentenyldiphosphate isomerase